MARAILKNSKSSIQNMNGKNWKMFGLKERLDSTKQGVFKAFKPIRAIGIKSVNASSDPKEEANPLKRVEAFIIESKHTNEVETKKAMVIFLSRHERWKAGGPV